MSLYPTPVTSEAPSLLAAPGKGSPGMGVSTRRGCVDFHWAAIFLVGCAIAISTGFSFFSTVQDNAAKLQSCQKFKDYGDYQRHLAKSVVGSDTVLQSSFGANSDNDMHSLFLGALCVFGVAFGVGTLFLLALEKEAGIIAWVSVCTGPFMLLVSGVFLLQNAQHDPAQQQVATTTESEGATVTSSHNAADPDNTTAYCLIGLAALFALLIVCKRGEITLTAELLKMSATAAKENRAIIYTIGLTSVGFGMLLVLPMAGLTVFAAYPQRTVGALAGCVGCFPLTNTTLKAITQLCPKAEHPHFQEALDWASSCSGTGDAHAAILVLMIVWTHFLSQEVRVANIGGTIGLHYFQQPIGGNRSVQAVKWALTKNFGSLCFASLVMTLMASVGALIQKLKERADKEGTTVEKYVMRCIACLWRCLAEYLEFLTKMTVISMVITGESFCKSARSTHKLLLKHNLAGVVLDAFTKFILLLFTLAVGVGLAVLAYWIAPHSLAKALSLLTFWLAVGVCGAQSGIILSISNAHYMCYVLDLESGATPHAATQHIHELYSRAINGHRSKNVSQAAAAGGYVGAGA